MFLFSINGKKNNSSGQELNDICEKYYIDIYKYCAARLDISYAEDITNEVFELLCQKWQNLENKNYKSWLYKTADNFIKNFHKKHKRRIEKEMYIDDSITDIFSYEQNFEIISDEEIEKYKDEILKILTERERQLFDMKYIEKLSIAQIGEILHISKNNVKQRLYRLREKIKIEITQKLK